jgi:hypothetical protein
MEEVISVHHSFSNGWPFASDSTVLITSIADKCLFSSGHFEALAKPNEQPLRDLSPPVFPRNVDHDAIRSTRSDQAKLILQRIFPNVTLTHGIALVNGKLLRPNAAEYKSQSKAEVRLFIKDQASVDDYEYCGEPVGGIVFEISFKGPIDDFIVDIHKRISQSVVEAAQTPEFRGDADTLQVIDSFSRNWPSEATFHHQTDSAESRPRMQA